MTRRPHPTHALAPQHRAQRAFVSRGIVLRSTSDADIVGGFAAT
jgi:hypothetical protein